MKTHIFTLALLCALVFTGCCNVHDIPPAKGGSYSRTETFALPTVEPATLPTNCSVAEAPLAGYTSTPLKVSPAHPAKPQLLSVTETFTQGENADSSSTFKKGHYGEVEVKIGPNRSNQTEIPPAPDYTPYILLGASILFVAGGAVLTGYGWPRIGWRLMAGGTCGVVLSLTVNEYGWVYVLAILGAAGLIAYEKYTAYRVGEGEGAKDTTTTTSTDALIKKFLPSNT